MALWTLVLWVLAGASVAALLHHRDRRAGFSAAVRVPLHLVLWPIFVPLLLPRQPHASGRRAATASARSGPQEWDAPIRHAQAALETALDGLSRQVEDPLSLERARVNALGRAMRGAAARLMDLDRVLADPDYDLATLRGELQQRRAAAEAQPVLDVFERRVQHVERLGQIRQQARTDLERALGEAAALASRLTLMRYEGRGDATSAAACARELTDTVEELCRVLIEARAA